MESPAKPRGGAFRAIAPSLLSSKTVASPPLPGVTAVRAQPIPTDGVGSVVPPTVLPGHIPH
jgi:hypothetical protein